MKNRGDSEGRFWAQIANDGECEIDVDFRIGPTRSSLGGLAELDPERLHVETVRRRIKKDETIRVDFRHNSTSSEFEM